MSRLNQLDIIPKNVKTQNSDSTFVIASGDNLPVFNSLKAGYETILKKQARFVEQFQLPELVTINVQTNTLLFLPDYTIQKPEVKPLNIFNPKATISTNKKSSQPEQALPTTKKGIARNTHKFSALDGGMKKTDNTAFSLTNLQPVPIIKLPIYQQNYTQKINNFLNYSPGSQNQFKTTDAMWGIVIGFVLFFLYIRTAFGRQMNSFLKSTLNPVRATNLLEESNIIVGRASFFMNLFYFFTLGLLATLALDYWGIKVKLYSQLTTFFVMSAVIVVWNIAKWLFGWFLAYILKIQDNVREYFFHSFVFNKTYSIITFPFLLAIPYIHIEWGIWVFKGTLLLLGVFYIMRFFRNIILSTQRNISLFYLFLYLCALEIMPILVMIKLASNWLKLSIF